MNKTIAFSGIICLAVSFIGLGSVAMAEDDIYGYSPEANVAAPPFSSVRANLSEKEKVTLSKEEDKSLSSADIKWRSSNARSADQVKSAGLAYHKEHVAGSMRANLTETEKDTLAKDEDRSITMGEMKWKNSIEPSDTTKKTEGLGYHKEYVPGSVRANLSPAEKMKLADEEKK